jgi:hypothetical protein
MVAEEVNITQSIQAQIAPIPTQHPLRQDHIPQILLTKLIPELTLTTRELLETRLWVAPQLVLLVIVEEPSSSHHHHKVRENNIESSILREIRQAEA